jgi:hypothetical protein
MSEMFGSALGFVETPGPGADFRARAESRPCEEAAFVAFHPHCFARVTSASGDCAIKHPGVAPQQ